MIHKFIVVQLFPLLSVVTYLKLLGFLLVILLTTVINNDCNNNINKTIILQLIMNEKICKFMNDFI